MEHYTTRIISALKSVTVTWPICVTFINLYGHKFIERCYTILSSQDEEHNVSLQLQVSLLQRLAMPFWTSLRICWSQPSIAVG